MAGKYIELVGVAGAGKTAIAKTLVDEALRREVNISPRGVVGRNLRLRVQTLFTIAMIVLLVPRILSLYLLRTRSAYAHTPHVKKIKRNLITRMIVDTAVVRCLQRRSSGYLVNDEGLLGKLVSLSVLTEITPSKMQFLVGKLLPTPAMLIYVTVPPMVALAREHKRDVVLPFFNDMAYDLKETFFRDAVRIYMELAETEAWMSNVETVSINNASSYDDLTKEVISVAKTLRSVVLPSKDGHFSV
jgi:thymidylate kinase